MASLAEVIRDTQGTLESAAIPEARLEAEVLLINILQVPRHRIYAYQEQELTYEQSELLAKLVDRRLKREPLAYILGHREFYGVELAVGPGVMIPRPETELLVEQGLILGLMHMEEGGLVIAEPGTGSGAISINLALHLPMARVYATELHPEAWKVAQHNIARHNVGDRITLLEGDLLDPIEESVDVIVANLPYIPSDEIAALQPEIQWEPRGALDGGPDGLDVIRRLLRQAQNKLRDSGVVILEMDPRQAEPLETLSRELFPGASISVEQDLARLDRMLVVDLARSEG